MGAWSSAPKYAGLRLDALSAGCLSLSNDVLAVLDRGDSKSERGGWSRGGTIRFVIHTHTCAPLHPSPPLAEASPAASGHAHGARHRRVPTAGHPSAVTWLGLSSASAPSPLGSAAERKLLAVIDASHDLWAVAVLRPGPPRSSRPWWTPRPGTTRATCCSRWATGA